MQNTDARMALAGNPALTPPIRAVLASDVDANVRWAVHAARH
jgi:hypothetical protein